jgi:DNA-binding response OmpR family regulator
MKPTILIIEDDTDINNLLAEILRRDGYGVAQAFSGTEGRLLFSRQAPGLVLLDLMLPGMNGEELIPLIRERGSVPVIVLSAKGSARDKVSALRGGADDYMTKPFDADELLARVEAALRRAAGAEAVSARLSHRDIEMDCDARQVWVRGEPAALTAREFDILRLLLSNPQKVFTKANLYRSVWNDEFLGDDNTVNVHISNLRAKLGGDYIQTVWGIGFKLGA